MPTTVAIHQPNYLPWPGYFHKILAADVFVLLDNVKYTSGSFINRNKIRTSEGWMWLTVPTSESSDTSICETPISTSERWQKTHCKSIRIHYSNADHFDDLRPFLGVYDEEWSNLCNLNICTLRRLTEVLGIETRFFKSSEMTVSGSKTDLLVDICEHFDADTYFSGAGAQDYQDETVFEKKNIAVEYQSFEYPEYKQQFKKFIPDLSVVDMIANVGADETVNRLAAQRPDVTDDIR